MILFEKKKQRHRCREQTQRTNVWIPRGKESGTDIYTLFFFLAALGLSCGTRDLSFQYVGSSLQCAGSRACRVSSCGAWALQLWGMGSRVCGLCSCGAQAPERVGSVAVARGLSSCGAQAQQLRHAGLVAPQHVGSQFPYQGSNPHPLHWEVDS